MFNGAIRSLIISLKRSNGGKFPNSIVVTSARNGEGKSLVARSLAIELVANGSAVLLVDGDLRLGHRNSLFTSGEKHGLIEFLDGDVGLRDVIHHHPPSGVDMILTGNPILRRAHLPDVTEIINLARETGQIVIFDSAPALTSTDTIYMIALAERTLMVVQWAKTGRRSVEFCVQHLKNLCNTEISMAINQVRPKKHSLYHFRDSELYADP